MEDSFDHNVDNNTGSVQNQQPEGVPSQSLAQAQHQQEGEGGMNVDPSAPPPSSSSSSKLDTAMGEDAHDRPPQFDEAILMVTDSSNNEQQPPQQPDSGGPALLTKAEADALVAGDYVDHRDSVGKWLSAMVKKRGRKNDKVFLHYEGWAELKQKK